MAVDLFYSIFLFALILNVGLSLVFYFFLKDWIAIFALIFSIISFSFYDYFFVHRLSNIALMFYGFIVMSFFSSLIIMEKEFFRDWFKGNVSRKRNYIIAVTIFYLLIHFWYVTIV